MWTLGGKELDVQARVGSSVRVPARRPSPHRHRPNRHAVRRAEARRTHTAVARDHGRHLDSDTKTATLVTQDLHSPALAAAFEGNFAGAAGRRRLRWLGAAAVLHRVQHEGRDRLRRPVRGQQLELSRLSLPVGRDAATTSPAVAASTSGASDHRLRELERRHRGDGVEGARRRELERSGGGRPRPSRGSRRR